MNSVAKQTFLWAAAAIVLPVTALWSMDHYRDAKAAAIASAKDLQRCRELADSIGALTQQQPIAATDQLPISAVTTRLEKAARAAGFANAAGGSGAEGLTGVELPKTPGAGLAEAGAAAQATGAILRIGPQPPRRLADSVYLEKPTQVSVRQLTLQQLITFLHDLSDDSSNLWVPSLRIRSSQVATVAGRWDAEMTVSYLIYSPIQPAGTGGQNQ